MSYIKLVMFGVSVIILLITGFVIKKNERKNYDERQLTAQNAAYKTAFIVLVSYCWLCGCLNILDIRWAAVEFQMFSGIMVSFTVFICISVIKDAAFTMKEKPIIMILLLYLVSAGCLISFCFYLKGMPLFHNGQISKFTVIAVASICFAVMGTVALVKHLHSKKAGDSE